MKNKTILKAVKIALVVCFMLTACIIPTFAETATIPEYNGYIPEGEYIVTTLPTTDVFIEGYAISGDAIYFLTVGDSDYNIINYYEGQTSFVFSEDIEALSVNVFPNDSFIVNQNYYCTEVVFNDFMQYFAPVVEPEPEPPINIYQTCYDLINTYVFGGTVVANTYQDLICIAFSAAACIFLMSLPFLLVWIIIKVWF